MLQNEKKLLPMLTGDSNKHSLAKVQIYTPISIFREKI